MSWLSTWFGTIKWKVIFDLGVKILKIFLGKVAEELMRIAKEEVAAAEATGKTGTEKYEIAFKAITKRFPEIRERFINAAIEVCVLVVSSMK